MIKIWLVRAWAKYGAPIVGAVIAIVLAILGFKSKIRSERKEAVEEERRDAKEQMEDERDEHEDQIGEALERRRADREKERDEEGPDDARDRFGGQPKR